MEQQIHLGQQIGERLGFAAPDAFLLQSAPLFHTPALSLEVIKCLHQKAAGAAGRVQDGLSQLGIGNRHHELDYRPGGIELP